MKLRFTLLLILATFTLHINAQKRTKFNEPNLVKAYTDSLSLLRTRIDTMTIDSSDIRFSVLFEPMTFYSEPIRQMLRLGGDKDSDSAIVMINRTLMNVYLNRPDLVRYTEKTLIARSKTPDALNPKEQKSHPDIIGMVAPRTQDADVMPMDLLVQKPNFWTIGGDYYLQFMQNYVSANWYKGGQSNYSMLGNLTLEANYNNKQKFKWDNKLEMRLGMQTASGDSIHKLMTTEDLFRYTGKVGLQATKRWYYTLQVIASTQFTHTYKSNDPFVYASFMSPFKMNASLGMDRSISLFNKRLTGTIHLAPFALDYVHVNRGELATRNGIDEGKHNSWDYGSEFTVDLSWKFSDMVSLKTRAYGYTTYKRTEMEWENTFTFQFTKYISSKLFVYPRFNDKSTRDEHYGYFQLKEYLSVGFSYSF